MDFSSSLNGKNILVTGGTGSFGHQMIKELEKYKPKSIVIFSRDEDKQWQMKLEFSNEKNFSKMKFLIGDVRDYDRIFYDRLCGAAIREGGLRHRTGFRTRSGTRPKR